MVNPPTARSQLKQERAHYTRTSRFGGKSSRRFTKKSLDRIAKVENCTNIVSDWDDWTNEGFEWLRKPYRHCTPPPILTVSQWADLYRQITPEFSAESGQWHTNKFEPMRAVMDACSAHSKYRRVVLVKPVQSGGTESLVLNQIGYTIDIHPRSMLVVFPTLDACESFSKERLEPMIELMPQLKNKVVSPGWTKAGTASTVKKKKYPGGFLNMVGANSTTGLSSRPVPVVMLDEVDLCIKQANRQGNPVKLALARTTTFPDKKEILLSSPSNDEGESGIIPFWEEGSRGKLERCCPNINCQHYQVLEFERMDVETATLSCELCGQYYPQWKWQSDSYRWSYESPDNNEVASFWMTGLDSPWMDWKIDICADYLACKELLDKAGDDSLMRVFVNSKLAKYYRRRGKKVEVDLYHERREVYDCHSKGAELPDGTILVTAGVDVMDNFLAYDVTAWGRGRESWGIETGEFPGDSNLPDVWKQLDEFVYNRIWRYSDGSFARTRLMFVDSQGHCTDAVYKYTKVRSPRCFAIKGFGGPHAIIVTGKKRQKGEGAFLITLGVDTLKDEFHSRLAIEKPGPGYCHWPMLANGMPACGYTMEYFEEIVSEQRELTYNKSGFAEYKWTKNRTDSNEALDCRNYSRAALEYLRVRLEQMPRDVLANLNQDDIEKVEIGDKIIYVAKGKIKTNKDTNKYGNRTLEGIDVPDASQARQSQAERQKRRSQGRYGAAAASSF